MVETAALALSNKKKKINSENGWFIVQFRIYVFIQ